jgi:hypothetical protein
MCLRGMGDRVGLETAVPPVLGKENGRQAVHTLVSIFLGGHQFFVATVAYVRISDPSPLKASRQGLPKGDGR